MTVSHIVQLYLSHKSLLRIQFILLIMQKQKESLNAFKKNWAWYYAKLKHVISDNAITLCNSLTTVIKAKIFNYYLLHAEHTSTQRLTHLSFSYQNSCSRCFAVVLIPSSLCLKCSCPEYRTLTPSAWDSRPASDLPSDFVVEKTLRFYWPLTESHWTCPNSDSVHVGKRWIILTERDETTLRLSL